MEKERYEYIVRIPEIYAGEVMGRLTVLDVAVEDIETKNATWTITAQSGKSIINEFGSWLKELTDDVGVIEEQKK